MLEIGPGYGRLLRSALEQGVAFESWTGVDLSGENVNHLRREFARPDVDFVVDDVERIELEEPADTMLSSLTFKHLFPSFEAALANLASQLRPGAVVVFDLIEGRRRYFEDDEVTYIRHYERREVNAILERVGFESAAFDEVQHHPEIRRLLVVACSPDVQ